MIPHACNRTRVIQRWVSQLFNSGMTYSTPDHFSPTSALLSPHLLLSLCTVQCTAYCEGSWFAAKVTRVRPYHLTSNVRRRVMLG